MNREFSSGFSIERLIGLMFGVLLIVSALHSLFLYYSRDTTTKAVPGKRIQQERSYYYELRFYTASKEQVQVLVPEKHLEALLPFNAGDQVEIVYEAANPGNVAARSGRERALFGDILMLVAGIFVTVASLNLGVIRSYFKKS